jgi:hypothetical protein
VNLPARLCLNGQVYGWSVTYEGQDEATRVKVVMTEITVPMGELKLSGTLIDELDLEGHCTVMLYSPGPTARIPAGHYNRKRVYLKAPGSPLEATARIEGPFQVAADQITEIKVGGPLRHQISTQRRGPTLVLNYRLIGEGGSPYTLSSQDRSKPPEFAIYQGDKKVHTGKFEFG